MSELRIYIADFGVNGNEIAIASSPEEALTMMREGVNGGWRSWEDIHSDDLLSYPIARGYVTGNLGDM